MKTRNFIFLAAALVLCSCIPSVNPFYTDNDVISDSRLVGQWRSQDSDGEPHLWSFEAGDNKTYKLTVTEKDNKQGQFTAHLFKLQQEFFIDIIPSNCDYATNQSDLVAVTMFPGHLLVRVGLGAQLKLAFFDFDWLQKYLEQNPKALAYHKEDSNLLLTADTHDLQQFVLKHLGTNELFQKTGVLTRQTNNIPAATQP